MTFGGVRRLPTDSRVKLHLVHSSVSSGAQLFPRLVLQRLGREDVALDIPYSCCGFILIRPHPLGLPRRCQAHVRAELIDGAYLKADGPQFGGVCGCQVQSGVTQTEPYGLWIMDQLQTLRECRAPTWDRISRWPPGQCCPLQCDCTLVSASLPTRGGGWCLCVPPREGGPEGSEVGLGTGLLNKEAQRQFYLWLTLVSAGQLVLWTRL